MSPKRTSGSTVKTTKTVFSVIETLYSLDGATLTELAENIEFANSTVYNHLTTLRNLGYVIKKGNEYYLSMRFLNLGNYVQYREPEFELVESAIEELATASGERAAFVIPENFLGSCVFTKGGSHAVQLKIQAGDNLYLHCTASGKAILAHMSEENVAEVIERTGLPAVTPNSIVEEDALLAELEQIRDEGIAFNMQESVGGMVSIGTPILPSNTTEVLGAISISGPAHRMEDEQLENELRNLLLGTVNEIEINIDHSI